MMFSKPITDKISNPFVVTFVSLLLVSGGCWLMSYNQVSMKYYLDASMGGYILIAVGTALISTVSFEEILRGTQSTIEQSNWREILVKEDEQVFIETACLCQTVILIGYVLGPPIGGALANNNGKPEACQTMAKIGSIYCGVYLVLSLIIFWLEYCKDQSTKRSGNKKKDDNLSWYLSEIADQRSSYHSS